MLKLRTGNTKHKETPNINYEFQVGDTIVVTSKVQEEKRTRLQKFEGVVIGIKGKDEGKTFTLRRIGTADVGIERIFPVFSPNITNIEIKKKGKARRAKLYYLRDRKGKKATYVKPR